MLDIGFGASDEPANPWDVGMVCCGTKGGNEGGNEPGEGRMVGDMIAGTGVPSAVYLLLEEDETLMVNSDRIRINTN